MLLIFGGFGHDDHGHDNLTGVDSTPVNCGEEKTGFGCKVDLETGEKHKNVEKVK